MVRAWVCPTGSALCAKSLVLQTDCCGLTCMPLGRCLLVPVTLVLFGKTPAMKLAADMMVLSRAELRTSVLRRW